MLSSEFLSTPFAHRGYHDLAQGCPENSRSAFLAAVRAGYGIELDLQLSSDGDAIVFHDYDLGRLTGQNGAVRQSNTADLGKLRLAGSNETIPTLTQVLELVGGRVPLLIELKDQDGALGSDVGLLEQATCTALASYKGPAALMSFNPYSVACFKEMAPTIPRGLTTGSFSNAKWHMVPASTLNKLQSIPDYDRVGACFISHAVDELSDARVSALKDDGTSVLCWTVRSQAQETAARKFADNVTFEGYVSNIPTP